MLNTKSQPAASPKKAGYPQNTSTPGLAHAWLAYCQSTDSALAADHLANHLDALFKRRVPDGHYTGVLKGRDEDVRQEAYLLLIGNYLAGNPDLVVATASGDQRAIAEEIQKSLAGSVRAVSKTLKKRILRHQKTHVYGEDLDTHANYTCIHPSCRRSIWELPIDLQRKIVFASLSIAIRDKLILARSAKVAMDMIESGLSQSQVARSRGVSRQTVHAILDPVRKHLAKVVATQEFPLT